MAKIPVLIVVLLVLTSCLGILYLVTSETLTLNDAELVSSIISILACLGAFVSATFLVYSYVQTYKTFVENRRPQLLVWVKNLKAKNSNNPNTLIPLTRIHYRNITANKFFDLTIAVTVKAENRTIDLSDLFRANMTMIGLDTRKRTFNQNQMLKKQGMDIEKIAKEGNEVILNISYSYTFNKIKDIVDAQRYRWNAERRVWEIT